MSFWLIMQSETGDERTFPLDKSRTVIGREAICDVRIPLRSVDRRHCEIIIDDGAAMLTDLGSEVGTFHNGSRVDSTRLEDADTVRIGPVTFLIRQQRSDDDGVTEVEIQRHS